MIPMTTTEILLTVGVIAAGTLFTRFFPFLVFPPGRETPDYVRFLGRALPPAVLGMLVIYCYKTLDLGTGVRVLPQLLAGAVVVVLQKWKRNLFLSILGGTALYMILIRLPVFQ